MVKHVRGTPTIFLSTKKAALEPDKMSLLRLNRSFLLELPLRILHLPGLHAGQSVGNVLQWHHLAVSRLRRTERFRQPVTGKVKGTFSLPIFLHLITLPPRAAEMGTDRKKTS